MRHPTRFIWLVALAGCDLDDSDFHFSLGSTTPSAEVDYDGSSLAVSTCIDGGLLGCNAAPTDSLYVIVDGGTYWGATEPTLLGDGPLAVTTKAPWDGRFVLAIDQLKATIDLPSGFTISAPSTVSRAAGPVPIAFDMVDSFGPATASVRVETTCDGVDYDKGYGEVMPGQVEVTVDDVAGASGTCTHAVTISELVTASARAIETTIVRTEVATFTSSP